MRQAIEKNQNIAVIRMREDFRDEMENQRQLATQSLEFSFQYKLNKNDGRGLIKSQNSNMCMIRRKL